MNIKIGIHDLFSYAIAGVLYLFEVAWIFISFNPNKDYNFIQLIMKLSFAQIFIIFILAYIVGHIFSAITKQLWRFIPNVSKIKDEILIEVLAAFPMLEFKSDSKHWSVMYALSQHTNRDELIYIEWYEAIFLMLRNLSLSLLIFSIYELIFYFYTNMKLIHLVFGIVFLFLFLLMTRHSIESLKNYFRHRYSAIIGSVIKPEAIISIQEQQGNSSK